MSSYSSGAKVTLVSQWLKLSIQLVGFVVLSRLLTPDDFGIVAMVAVVVAFAALVGDFGLSLAGLQARDLNQRQKSGLFWMNTLAGFVGMLLVAASGPFLAAFYDEPRVVGLTLALSAGLLLSGMTAQFRVEINRGRRFQTLAVQDVASSLGGLIAATTAALGGLGYWALAIQTLIQAAFLLVLSVAQARWLPGWPSRNSGIRHLLLFGTDNFALQLLNFVSRSADVMAIGRVAGADALGIYSRSSQLVTLTIQQLVSPLTRAVLPGLAGQQGTPSFNRTLLRLQRIIVYVLSGVLSLLSAASAPLVAVVLGPDWVAMSPVIQVLAVGAVLQGLGYVYYWAFLALAQTRLLLYAELPGRVGIIVGSVLCAQFGIIAVAWVVTLGQAVIWLCSSLFFARRIGVSSGSLNRVAARPATVFGLAFAFSIAGQALIGGPEVSPLILLLVSLACWGSVAALSLISHHVRTDLGLIFVEIKGLKK